MEREDKMGWRKAGRERERMTDKETKSGKK